MSDPSTSASSSSTNSVDDTADGISSLKINEATQPPVTFTDATADAVASSVTQNGKLNERPSTGGPQRTPSSSSSATSNGPSASGGPPSRGGGGGPPRGYGGSAMGGGPPGPGGPMNAQERARQMAGTKLPPSLQAKLAANAARSSNAAPGNASQSPTFLKSNQRIDPSSLLARGGPSGMPSLGGGQPFPSASSPGMGGLAARRAGGFSGGPMAGGMGAPGGAGAGKRPKPGLKLSDMGVSSESGSSAQGEGEGAGKGMAGGQRAPPPGRLAAAPKGATMSSAFADFSDVIDPSGRLNFAGKAILHESGVEFGNGTSFKINMEDLELQDVLGKGNYGEVRKVKHSKTGVEMAMKEIRLELDKSKLNAIIMELDILHRAVSPEIVEFYGAFFVESCVFYCMEYMDASLDKLYDGRCSVPEPVLARIVKQMVKGLAFLKDELQIMHRDVKPTNVLVNRRGEVKLCDFGVSGQLEKSLAKTNIGCQSYMAPERIKGESMSMPSTYTVASDVWSLGLSIVETSLGVYPYPPETYSNVFAQLQAIVHGDPPQLPAEAYSDKGRDFVACCLEKVPERRATYAQMLRHPWLVADDERGPDGVDMKGWAEGALKRRDEKKAAAKAAPA